MDINNPNILWKEYDVAALPLNAYELSQKTSDGADTKEFYFDGYTTVDGRIRAYLKAYKKSEQKSKGVILYLGDDKGEFDGELIRSMLEYGYTVCSLDYLGKNDNKAHFTLYPESLENCNMYGVNEYPAPDVTNKSYWYIWTCIARRAILLIKEQFPNEKIFAIGIGLGGCTVYKLAAFEDGLTACATLLDIIPDVIGTGNPMINYRASLDNSAYSVYSKIPMYIAVSSNDEDGSLDEMSDLAKDTKSIRHFRIVERAFKHGISVVYDSIDKFFSSDDPTAEMQIDPKITASNSEGNLYFNIKSGCKEEDERKFKLSLYVSFCIKEPQFRNWMKLPVISLGNDYIANINVCDNTNTITAFANYEDESGDILSSPVFSVLPKTLGISGKEGVKHHKIYDGSMGIDGWASRKGGKISVVQGPYEIEGVTNENNSLATFKPGDSLFRVASDVMLQLMICGKAKNIKITVHTKTNEYFAYSAISSENDWNKISLTHSNFKNTTGVLPSWADILILEIDADDSFIIGSVLWV